MDRNSNILSFGEDLLWTEDLDPLYVGLRRLGLPPRQLHRWLVAYWCFYHVGAASWLSEHAGSYFWTMMKIAGQNELPPITYGIQAAPRWPRGAERRHFRGQACVNALEKMSAMHPMPEDLVTNLTTWSTINGRLQQRDIMLGAQQLPLFGPWISFKIADMLERVCGVPVEFERNIGLIYKEPRAGLEMWHSRLLPGPKIEERYEYLLGHFSSIPAPPVDGPESRGCGPQEVETILCKWKSHMGGHYYVGKDIRDHREALPGWGVTAERLLEAYPPLPSSGA